MKSTTTTWGWLGYIAVLVWFSVATSAVFMLADEKYIPFDDELMLSQALMDPDFETALVAALPTGDRAVPSIFHIVQGDCFCEWVVRPHRNNLSDWSLEYDFSNQTIQLDDYPELKNMIPSTPALVALDANQHVIYLGPYARGKGCFTGSGMADEYLSRWVKAANNQPYHSTIATDGVGCYCAT